MRKGRSETQKRRSRNASGAFNAYQVVSDSANVLRFFALLARHDVEFDALTLIEGLVAIALDAGEMDENVITLLTRDEAETLFCIEKLHCTLCHENSLL